MYNSVILLQGKDCSQASYLAIAAALCNDRAQRATKSQNRPRARKERAMLSQSKTSSGFSYICEFKHAQPGTVAQAEGLRLSKQARI
eukprot:4586-Heterococcus_DN1.PRE.5